MNPIIIYTHGSCETQTRLGGWASVLSCGEHQRVLLGSTADTTVNAMELTDVVEALKVLKQAGSSVQLFTDSNYVVRGDPGGTGNCLISLRLVQRQSGPFRAADARTRI